MLNQTRFELTIFHKTNPAENEEWMLSTTTF